MNNRVTKSAQIFRVGGTAAILCLGIFVFANRSFAQGAPRPNQSQGTQANPLPLSGRSGQSGSVVAVESPIAGTTTSVNTINPHAARRSCRFQENSLSAKPSSEGSTSILASWGSAMPRFRRKGKVRLREAPCFPI